MNSVNRDKLGEEYNRGFWHGTLSGASIVLSLLAITITILANIN
jgi:hypothetical protein